MSLTPFAITLALKSARQVLFCAVGVVCTFLGLIGWALPIIPGLLYSGMAAVCFSKSWEWAYVQFKYGRATQSLVANWELGGYVARRHKVVIGIAVLVGWTFRVGGLSFGAEEYASWWMLEWIPLEILADALDILFPLGIVSIGIELVVLVGILVRPEPPPLT